MSPRERVRGSLVGLLVATVGVVLASLGLLVSPPAAAPAGAATPALSTPALSAPAPALPMAPEGPTAPRGPQGPDGPGSDSSVTIDLDGLTDKPGTPVTVILALSLLSLLPAILLTCTSFTKVLVVLGLTRNALGLQQIPPNQVLAGLALFLSLFIMAPVLSEMNDTGLQPYLDGDKTVTAAYTDGVEPLRDFMLDQTGDDELRLLTNVAGRELPENRDEVSMATLVPSFVLSELKQAFIIGFIIFIPFLVIDIVISGALMALGMMMMPPVMVSLPFKLLLFVLVDGWGLVITSIVSSYE
ncbi:flagellar type III secretion system pore protein FliP [Nocardioides sp. Soil805]|uniref:flagellar type III secretion system pore protein FliP n=1 Tax=Nocardioides sp. Soil805 TaxID=1736416 RepID=UPI000AFC6ECA|nr:flagellar type III secretion system pore protein FliP [Nocardioides sp. Soil805]